MSTPTNTTSFFEEFKRFILSANLVGSALGIIIGLSFSKVVSSLVADVIMPPISLLIGAVHLEDMRITLRAATEHRGAIVLNYGNFIQSTIDFLIVALCVFLIIKAVTHLTQQSIQVEVKLNQK